MPFPIYFRCLARLSLSAESVSHSAVFFSHNKSAKQYFLPCLSCLSLVIRHPFYQLNFFMHLYCLIAIFTPFYYFFKNNLQTLFTVFLFENNLAAFILYSLMVVILFATRSRHPLFFIINGSYIICYTIEDKRTHCPK
jgi:hypothetical protein